VITLEQVTEMLNMQEQLEVRIGGKDWRDEDHDYALCVHMECAEIIDHVGWKHWKHEGSKPHWDEVAMEVVDIWHFALAHSLMHLEVNPKALYDAIIVTQNQYRPDEDDTSIIDHCIGLGYTLYTQEMFSLGSFIAIMDMANMSWEQLYRLYIGKNILNWFRQDHGYKEGLYLKNWGGHEDNEHLLEITNTLGDSFSSVELVKCLTARYALAGH
jgi:dimeric dUTPase (all-alpha-NTP-PPase superfamily)